MALSLPIRGRTLCACEPTGVSLPAATSYSIISSAQHQIVCLFMAPASSWSAFPEEAVVQSTEIGAVNSWLRNQPAQVISAAVASLREALAPYGDSVSVRLRGAVWLISSTPA